MTEEICGRFGRIDYSAFAYRLVRGFGLDDTRSASLSCMDFGFLRETDVHQTDDFPGLADRGDVQRFERQGYDGNIIST